MTDGVANRPGRLYMYVDAHAHLDKYDCELLGILEEIDAMRCNP